MSNGIKKIARKIIQKLGFNINRRTPSTDSGLQLLKGLDCFGIDLVLDVGGNIGQFACELRSNGYRGRIVSFEPLPDAHKKISEISAKDALWDVYVQGAIGDFDGEIEINIAGNSVSSSVLPMLDSCSNAAQGAAYTGKVKVPISRLDTVVSQYISKTDNYFIKIDTQGFEWQVLDGAQDTLAKALGVLCELSLVPLYDGQRLWREIIDRLTAEGFTLWAIQEEFTDLRNGKTLQINAIFYRVASG